MNRHRIPASNTDNKLYDEVMGNIACSSMGSEHDANSKTIHMNDESSENQDDL